VAIGDGLQYVIYDKAGAFKASVKDADGSAEFLCNVPSSAEFILPESHRALPSATTDGARCGVWFRGVERFRGTIIETPGFGPVGETTVRVESDLRKLYHWQGWPVPTGAIGAQVDKARVYSGSVETVFKTALGHAFTRLGVPWSVTASGGLGFTTRVDFRFDYLADKLLPLLDLVPLVVTLEYGPGPLDVTVDVKVPHTVAGTLTVQTGVVDNYDFNRRAPGVTRMVIGGAGEGADREFDLVIDTAREMAWNDIIEGFADASSAEAGADLSVDAVEPLAEGAPTAMLSSALVETDRLVYGKHYVEGDLLHIKVGPIDSVQQIRGVSVTDNADEGEVVTPYFGDVDEDDTDVVLARQVSKLARGLRETRRR